MGELKYMGVVAAFSAGLIADRFITATWGLWAGGAATLAIAGCAVAAFRLSRRR